jgi:hypothetical protein
MQSKYDPFDLKISVSPHGGIDEWQWTLSIGNDAPIEIGVVKGSRMDGIRAAREERAGSGNLNRAISGVSA